MKYGVDVTSVRLDDLDKRLLKAVSEKLLPGHSVSVLDVGCGSGGLAVALAQVGVIVTALDIDNFKDEIVTLAGSAVSNRINFIQADVRRFVFDTEAKFDFVVLQRILHYLPYTEAKQLLERLHSLTSRLYLSVTGATTGIARHYDSLLLSIESRWGRLDKVGQELFSISAPLCLYSEAEVCTLLQEAGWEISWLRVSDFGNIKVEAVTS